MFLVSDSRRCYCLLGSPDMVLERLTEDDAELKDVNLNNVAGLEERQICEIFDSLRRNSSLTKLSVVNCDVSYSAVLPLHTVNKHQHAPNIRDGGWVNITIS